MRNNWKINTSQRDNGGQQSQRRSTKSTEVNKVNGMKRAEQSGEAKDINESTGWSTSVLPN